MDKKEKQIEENHAILQNIKAQQDVHHTKEYKESDDIDYRLNHTSNSKYLFSKF